MKHIVDADCAIPSTLLRGDYLKLGQLQSQNSALSKAYYRYHQALSESPGCPELHYKIALILHEWQEWCVAEQHYRAVVSIQPQCDAKVYFNWGLLNHQRGRYSFALVCYEKAVAAQPDYLSAYLNLGSVMLLMNWEEEAISLYQGILKQFPQHAELHNKLGYAMQQQGDRAAALEQYQTALRLEPNLFQAHQNLGRLWSLQGDRTKAIYHCRESVRLAPAPKTWGDLAALLLSQGQIDQALSALRNAVTDLSDVLEAYCQNALTQTSNSKLAQSRRACANFLQALKLPDSDDSRTSAQEWLFQVYCCSGAIAYESRSFRRAEMLYHQALNLRPNAQELAEKLANCLRQQGRKAAARAICPEQKPSSPAHQSRPPAPKNPQCGVTCQSCMAELIQAFHPEPLAKGLFRVRFEHAPSFATPKQEVELISQGIAWVSPKESDWAACREIVVTNASGKMMPRLSRSYPGQLPNCAATPQLTISKSSNRPDIKYIKGKVTLLSTLSGHIYYHWMIDLLPRLGILQQQGVSFTDIDWFVVNRVNSAFQRETLTQLGVPLEKVLESDFSPHIQADELIVPSFPGHLDWIPPETIDFLRSHFCPLRDRDKTQTHQSNQGHKRIYISRKQARYRHVLNEPDVIEILKPFGFQTICLEELTVAEQAKYFSEAEVIVSPHGSGLTNLVFCQPHTVIVEFFAPRYLRTDYWMISQYLRLKHYYILSREVACPPLRELMYQSPLTEDMFIELSALRSALNAIGVH